MIKTVLIHATYTDKLSYYDDWQDAFSNHAYYDTDSFNVCDIDKSNKMLVRAILDAEVIILHHSMTGDTLHYLRPLVPVLLQRRGKLVAFIGNEVNLPILGMKPKISILTELNVDIIATQLLQEAGDWLYSSCNTQVISLPHALNPNKFYKMQDHHNRKYDVATRTSRYGAYIGDNDRNEIVNFFHTQASRNNLVVNVGLEPGSVQRFDRNEWNSFLNNSKSTISTEAGSFFLQKDDAIIKEMSDFFEKKQNKIIIPKSGIISNIYRKIVPPEIKQKVRKILASHIIDQDKVLEELSFEHIYDQFFAGREKCPVYSKAISSRHFDAIGTHTLHVMYSGRYNDILFPGDHYFELARDHSNFPDLIEILRDNSYLEKITNGAFEYIADQHTHCKRLNSLYLHLDQKTQVKG